MVTFMYDNVVYNVNIMSTKKERLEKIIAVRVTSRMYSIISAMADEENREISEMGRELMKSALKNREIPA
jgi:hypothetical protein